MNNELNLMETSENVVEQTTEQTVEGTPAAETQVEEKRYSDEELDRIVAKRIARKEAKIRKEYEDKFASYKEAEHVLNAGLGTSDIKEATTNLKNFYSEKGIDIPQYQPSFNDDDMKVLASNEAQKIIEYGYDEVVDEVNRLAEKGVDNMTPREKLVFTQLAEYRRSEEDKKELAQIGVGESALQDSDFIEFAKDLNPRLSTREKYERYLKYKPKPQVETIGSMKNATDPGTGVKDFYTREEALKFTKADLDKNPDLVTAIERSMQSWPRG